MTVTTPSSPDPSSSPDLSGGPGPAGSPGPSAAAPDRTFEGACAVVTGGGRGIGHAIAAALAVQGARVALLDLDAPLEAAAALAASTGSDVVGVAADVTDAASLARAYDQVELALGLPGVLVTAAGIALVADAESTSPDDFRRVLDVNTTGTYLSAAEHARRLLAADREGAVVMIASMSAQAVNVPQHQSAYNASKAGVMMLARSLAVEWAPRGIRVNSLSPGYVATEMTRSTIEEDPERVADWTRRVPLGRLAAPADIAPAALFLASDAARYVVGHDLVVDGGYTAL